MLVVTHIGVINVDTQQKLMMMMIKCNISNLKEN